MKKVLIAAIWVTAAVFSACNSDNSGQNANETTTETAQATDTASTATTDTTLTNDQKEFMSEAYDAALLQIELGKIAQQKGRTNEVKQYGQKMVELYGNRQKELQQMAATQNVQLPTALDGDNAEEVQELQKAEAAKFDKAYWDAAVEAHQDALDEYDDVLKNVKQANTAGFLLWARNTRQEIQAQMEQAMRFRLDQRNP